jgi:hypothetical protein
VFHHHRRVAGDLLLIAGVALAAAADRAEAGNYVVYLHGRSLDRYPPAAFLRNLPVGWQNVAGFYNGNARIQDLRSFIVNNLLVPFCTGDNQCVVICHSAGCLRTLVGLQDVGGAGNLSGLLWVEAAASAAGGTRLANTSTQGFIGWLAKLFGAYASIDQDLRVEVARGTWGFAQDSMGQGVGGTKPMYHVAGGKNMCRRFLFFIKLCGNSHLGCAGNGDGAVGVDSACGYSSEGCYFTCTNSGSGTYAGRTCETCPVQSYADHSSILAVGVGEASARVLASGIGGEEFGDQPGIPDCDDISGECDLPSPQPYVTDAYSASTTAEYDVRGDTRDPGERDCPPRCPY